MRSSNCRDVDDLVDRGNTVAWPEFERREQVREQASRATQHLVSLEAVLGARDPAFVEERQRLSLLGDELEGLDERLRFL